MQRADRMAKIPLRAYTHEIEQLIAADQAAQAMAHCRSILIVYPRYLKVLRMLGNAGLLAADYTPAKAAYLQVLASIPDDLVSHIGLSVLLEISGDLEPAVWHMQRAFEIQPANPTLKEDLARLQLLRNNGEATSSLLSRYALARMYQKGGLYTQASAEISAALVEEPQRLDLQCLLIQIYRQSGKLDEAAQIAETVLEKLPDCLEANLALFQAGAPVDQADKIVAARQRLLALDPYYAGLSPDAMDPRLVPDAFIQFDRPDW